MRFVACANSKFEHDISAVSFVNLIYCNVTSLTARTTQRQTDSRQRHTFEMFTHSPEFIHLSTGFVRAHSPRTRHKLWLTLLHRVHHREFDVVTRFSHQLQASNGALCAYRVQSTCVFAIVKPPATHTTIPFDCRLNNNANDYIIRFKIISSGREYARDDGKLIQSIFIKSYFSYPRNNNKYDVI